MGNHTRLSLGIAIAIILISSAAAARTHYASTGMEPRGGAVAAEAASPNSDGLIAALGVAFVYGAGLILGVRGSRRRRTPGQRPVIASDDGGLRRLQHVKGLLRGNGQPENSTARVRRSRAVPLLHARKTA